MACQSTPEFFRFLAFRSIALNQQMREYILNDTHPTEVAFTGFATAERADLERMAATAGMHVRKSVTLTLTFLVAGPNAGPKKLATARGLNCPVISREEFEAKLTGADGPRP